MRNVVAGRWIGLVVAVAALSGCTSGSPGGPVTGPDLRSAGLAPTLSVSPSNDPVGDGPVLTVEGLPFPEPSGAALPPPRRQGLQQELDDAVRNSTRMPGVSAAVLSPVGAWTGAAGVDGAGAAMVAEAMTDIGSVTKTFTDAVLLLAGQRRV